MDKYIGSEREYQELERLGQKLGIPVPQTFLEMEVKMPDGKVLHHHKQRSHSWVRNAYNYLFSSLAGKNISDVTFGAGLLSLKDTAGTVTHGAQAAESYIIASGDDDTVAAAAMYLAIANQITGIQIGSGNTAESFEDIVLATPIASGAGAGQMAYQSTNTHSVSYVAGTKTLSDAILRFFNNNSGGSIDIKEAALVACGNSGTYKILMSRDVLGVPVTVPDTGQLKVTYTISLVYPS